MNVEILDVEPVLFLSCPKSVIGHIEGVEKNRFRHKDCRNDRQTKKFFREALCSNFLNVLSREVVRIATSVLPICPLKGSPCLFRLTWLLSI